LKALVTGGSGFLGRHLVAELQARGDEVTAMMRPSTAARRGADGADGVLACDLRRPPEDLASSLRGFDAIYHLVAAAGSGWREAFESNVAATEKLLDALAAAEWRGRFVHVSSFAVYGANQMPRGSTLDESAPLEPEPGRRDDYAWTKLLQERLVRERLAATEGVELVVVRPGAIYARERRFQYRLGRPLGDHAVLMLGGSIPMPLNYVENTASLLAECGHNPAAAGETFNAVDPSPPTQREYLKAWRRADPGLKVIPFPLWAYRLIARVLEAGEERSGGRTAPPAFLQPYVMEPSLRRLRYDVSRATELLGWEPPVAAAEALRRTFPPSSESNTSVNRRDSSSQL
jgi:nucleoside-diphosphate-sugar epimerase